MKEVKQLSKKENLHEWIEDADPGDDITGIQIIGASGHLKQNKNDEE